MAHELVCGRRVACPRARHFTAEIVGSAMTATGRISVERAKPLPAKVLRTRVGLAPDRIHRSAAQPQKLVETAMVK